MKIHETRCDASLSFSGRERKAEGHGSITMVARIRFVAAIAPVVLLIAAPFITGGFYVFGGEIDRLHDRELVAIQAARGMEIALYQMQWARTQRDGAQILIDQGRAFANWLDLAHSRAVTEDQLHMVEAIAQQAGPLFDELRNSAPEDESVGGHARNLHARIADLIGADDQMVIDAAAAGRRQATRLIAATVLVGVAIPWLCFALLHANSGRLRTELRTIRAGVERMTERPGASADKELREIDQSLTRLGFTKPNPMLAE
jgi:hypothetical protein